MHALFTLYSATLIQPHPYSHLARITLDFFPPPGNSYLHKLRVPIAIVGVLCNPLCTLTNLPFTQTILGKEKYFAASKFCSKYSRYVYDR